MPKTVKCPNCGGRMRRLYVTATLTAWHGGRYRGWKPVAWYCPKCRYVRWDDGREG